MPAFLSYAFFFRQKESVKKRTTKTSLHIPRPRQRDLTYLIQTTVFACLKNQSVAKVRFRDNFSVTSILIVIANSSVTENSSRAKFDSGFFSSQQPLRHGKPCHLPLHRGGKHTRRFYMHYQRNSILFCLFGCGFALPTPYTGEANTFAISTHTINLIYTESLVHVRPFGTEKNKSPNSTISKEAFHAVTARCR